MGRRASAFGYGTAIGTLGGLIGLGGAEFRLPVLMGPFGFAAHKAVPLNLLISLITIAASLGFRASVFPTGTVAPHLPEVMGLITGGVAAAWFGAGLLHRMSAHALERVIALLLLFIAALLLVEAVLPLGVGIVLPWDDTLRVAAGILFGVGIGLVSSLLGVAGGELIIPTLVMIFGLDIKTAGTASLLVSLPTVLVGVIRHARRGAYHDRAVLAQVASPMGAGSVIGAFAGAFVVGLVPVAALKAVLGAVLLISGVKMFNKTRGRQPREVRRI
jgi:uncharacterized protein